MSLCFNFELPVTRGFSFVESCLPYSDSSLLSEVNSARASMVNMLEQHSHGKAVDYFAIVKAIDNYLPLLVELYSHDNLNLKTTEAAFCWRFPSKSKISLPDSSKYKWTKSSELNIERSFVCLTYALSLVMLAQRSFNGSDDQWKYATAYLTKAQAVTTYLLQTLAVPAQDHGSNSSGSNSGGSEGLSHASVDALNATIAGSLHLVLLYKDISESVDEYYKTPRTQTSVFLITRGAIFAHEKFTSAYYLAGVGPGFGGDNMKSWLKDAQAYCSAYTQRLMAMEKHTKGEVGMALAYLNSAIDTLNVGKLKVFKSKKDGSLTAASAIGSAQANSAENLQQASIYLHHNLASLLKLYKRENDTVAFQKVPSSIDQSWPSGRQIIAAKEPWTPVKVSQKEVEPGNPTSRANYF